jgi:hypothetical protein
MITAQYLVRMSQFWSNSKVKKVTPLEKKFFSGQNEIITLSTTTTIFLKLKMVLLIKSEKN